MIVLRFLWNLTTFRYWAQARQRPVDPFPGFRLVTPEWEKVPWREAWQHYTRRAWQDALAGIWWRRKRRATTLKEIQRGT